MLSGLKAREVVFKRECELGLRLKVAMENSR